MSIWQCTVAMLIELPLAFAALVLLVWGLAGCPLPSRWPDRKLSAQSVQLVALVCVESLRRRANARRRP